MTRTELNNLYNLNKLRLTESAVFAINLGMQEWTRKNPWAEPAKRNKALRRRTVDLCLACPDCYTIM